MCFPNPYLVAEVIVRILFHILHRTKMALLILERTQLTTSII